MKRIFIFSICVSILTLSANGQSEALINSLTGGREAGVISLPTSMENIDTIPVVKYINPESDVRQLPAIYIDGVFVNFSRLRTIDPTLINSITVEKKKIDVEGKSYYGQVYLKMKEEYNPKLISLTDLVKKYTNVRNGLTIMMIDNELVKDDYKQYLVDEKFLLKIIVETIKKEKQNHY